MPTLDMSDVIESMEFTDFVDVLRQVETVNDFGEMTTAVTRIPRVPMVITADSRNRFHQDADFSRTERSITIVTKFMLTASSPTTQPDHIAWNGTEYKIDSIDLYNRFGAGFIQATAISVRHRDPSPGDC